MGLSVAVHGSSSWLMTHGSLLIDKMNLIKCIDEMRDWSSAQRRGGKRIAFVPTMGALHEGHLSLIDEGKRRCDVVVVSIYVNPTQFAANEDLSKYPRDLDGDLEKCRNRGTDAVFFPSNEMMYGQNYHTYVTVGDITSKLCGASRPTHFRGVATVVAKLFNIVEPDVAVLGEKDFQQLSVIRRMVADLNMPIEIVGAPIVRESDGLAMSSRNAYLSREEREAATSLHRSLNAAESMISAGELSVGSLIARVSETITSAGLARIDYVKFVDPETFEDLKEFRRPALLALAVFFGKTRLIDNRLFE